MLDFTTAEALVLDLLNASTGYANVSDDDRHDIRSIDDTIVLVDQMIVGAICNTQHHPQRSLFYEPVGVEAKTGTKVSNSGDIIPAHLGAPGDVRVGSGTNYNQPEPLPASEIAYLYTLRAEATVYVPIKSTGFFDIIDDRLYFIGPGANDDAYIDLCILPVLASKTLLTPNNYFGVIINTALSMLFGKEGAEVEAGSFYQKASADGFSLINRGILATPDVIPYQRDKKDPVTSYRVRTEI